MNERDNLIRHATVLSHASPLEWREFVEAVKLFADSKAKQCVQAPLEQLQVNQGRAQQAAEFVALLTLKRT